MSVVFGFSKVSNNLHR